MRNWHLILVILFGLACLLVVLYAERRPARLAPAQAAQAEPLQGEFGPAEAPTLIPTGAAPAPPRPIGAGFTLAPPGERRYIPTLMYHYVRSVDASADPLGYNLSVTPEQLAAQLGWLKAGGYETIRMDAAAACVRGEGPCPARAVALTFDDGYMDAYTAALPLLRQHGFVATFYIVSGFVGQPGYMGWEEIRALRDAGMEIGAHSVSHPDLTTLSQADAAAQIGQSGATIAAEIGAPVRSFCYPGGRFTDLVAALARDAGYTSATTTIQDAPQDNPFTLPRLRISGDLSQEGFEWTIQAYLP